MMLSQLLRAIVKGWRSSHDVQCDLHMNPLFHVFVAYAFSSTTGFLTLCNKCQQEKSILFRLLFYSPVQLLSSSSSFVFYQEDCASLNFLPSDFVWYYVTTTWIMTTVLTSYSVFFLKALTGTWYSNGITWHQSKEEHGKETQLLP